MYPHVIQFETRRQELERELDARRASTRTAATAPSTPPRYKLALLTWASAYTLITLNLAVLGPLMASWPLVLRTLVMSATMVVALTWIVMPRLTRLFRSWLTPSAA